MIKVYKVKITIIKKCSHTDLINIYELPQTKNPCPYKEGMTYLFDGYNKPKDLCESAWLNIYPYALALSSGGNKIFDNWLKNENSAIVSCNDGLRPVSFLLERID